MEGEERGGGETAAAARAGKRLGMVSGGVDKSIPTSGAEGVVAGGDDERGCCGEGGEVFKAYRADMVGDRCGGLA